MKPIFTIHTGEYLLGSYIEENFKGLNVWLPSKDTGIDLLITNNKNSKAVSVQVKFSKDFKVTHMDEIFQKEIDCTGFWTLNREKIIKSKADFWVFVLYGFNQKTVQYTFIKPSELLERIEAIHGKAKVIQTYLTVTGNRKCWETRGLGKNEMILIMEDKYINPQRDFTKYLNNWGLLKEIAR